MKKLRPEKQDLLLGAIIGLVILLTFYFIFLRPRIYHLRQLNSQLIVLTRDVQSTTKDVANIDNFRRELEDLRVKFDFYKQKLPREKEIPLLLKSLSEAAKNFQIKIIEIQTRNEDIRDLGEIYLEVPILIKASCGYHQLGKFINELESWPRFIKISNIEIKENTRDHRNHHVRLLLSMFVLSEEENVSKH